MLCRRIFSDDSLLKSLVCASSTERRGYLQKVLQSPSKDSSVNFETNFFVFVVSLEFGVVY